MSKREAWNERYASHDLVWGIDPNRFVKEAFADRTPGRVLDLACGEGRNALWLASRGWTATGVDFSRVALARARDRIRTRPSTLGEGAWWSWLLGRRGVGAAVVRGGPCVFRLDVCRCGG